jgi:hypothetical protein
MNIDWRTTYFDLCREIGILEIRVSDLEYQLKIAHSQLLSGKMPSDGHVVYVPLDIGLGIYDQAKANLLLCVTMLEHKKQTKDDIESRMTEFDGVTYKFLYMRDIQMKSLEYIADDLGYSLAWAKQISRKYARVKNVS